MTQFTVPAALLFILLILKAYAQDASAVTPSVEPVPTPSQTVQWSSVPVDSKNVNVNGVAAEVAVRGTEPKLKLLCTGTVLNGGIHFPWEASCNLSLVVRVTHPLASGGTDVAVTESVW